MPVQARAGSVDARVQSSHVCIINFRWTKENQAQCMYMYTTRCKQKTKHSFEQKKRTLFGLELEFDVHFQICFLCGRRPRKE